ncbi:MAG: hypothetical protein J7L55_06060 [Desulfurococcales archaeon]|nr:hypothetical protein [Desulfurococcales archaeon]
MRFSHKAFNPDHVVTGVSYAVIKVFEEVRGDYVEVIFPNKYLVDGREVGSLKLTIMGNEGEVTLKLRKDFIGETSAGFKESLISLLEDVLKGLRSGVLSRYVLVVGKHLRNLGEEVRITLTDGGVIEGEVIGFGRTGELIVLTGKKLEKVPPSKVRDFTVTWP